MPHIFNPYHSIKTSLIGFSALCDSIKCFRFLLINGAKLTNDDSILNLAIAGENVEIMQLLEQSQIRPGPSNIKYSIAFHRKETFDWLVDQFLESLDEESSSLSFEHEFLHGIYRLERISLSDAFLFSCMIGSDSLVKTFLFIKSPSISLGYTDIVKLLLSFPSIVINKTDAVFLFFKFVTILRSLKHVSETI